VVRFTNDEVLKNLEGVYEKLASMVLEREKILSRYRDSSFQKGAQRTPFRELLEALEEIE